MIKVKENQGITLIALVITIIVLLILAGISISMLAGENGILRQATEAKEKTTIAQIEEIANLAYTDYIANSYLNSTSTTAMTAVIEELERQGKTVTPITETETEITGVKLTSGGKNVTDYLDILTTEETELTVGLKKTEGESTTSYYVKINGMYYEMKENNGIKINRQGLATLEKEPNYTITIEQTNLSGLVQVNGTTITGETNVNEGDTIKILQSASSIQNANLEVKLSGIASDTLTIDVAVKEPPLIPDELKVGDYVNYPVYYENVGTWVDSSTGQVKGNIPADEYNGWRVLSIEGEGDNRYVRLVSAGVPLNYYHYNNSEISVENLTTKFFSTAINSTITQYSFYKCGFKTGESGTAITDIADLKQLFNNRFTAKYASGESATYTDSTLNKTFTNTEVEGQPKVQAMTKADLDAVWGSTTSYNTYVKTNDLLAIPCKGDESSEYAMTWLASAGSSGYLWVVGSSGGVYNNSLNGTYGVRPAVFLQSKVKFTQAETKINDVTTWNIE